MGGATALGLVRSGAVEASDVYVTARHEESLLRFREYGIVASTDNGAAAKDADILFIAVKPWQIEGMLSALKPCIGRQTLIASIAPGISPEALAGLLPQGQRIAYVIPNTAIEICRSMTYVSPVTASDEDMAVLKSLFSRAGKVQQVPVELMLSGTSLSSCGIAYALRYIEAAASAGEEVGLSAADALEAVCQTVLGAASLLEANGSQPSEGIRKVTTPDGLTERGLKAMDAAGFREAVAAGIKA